MKEKQYIGVKGRNKGREERVCICMVDMKYSKLLNTLSVGTHALVYRTENSTSEIS
jgi:hypothetical protein